MLTTLCWSDSRETISAVDYELAKLIDEVSPDDSFLMYKAEYSYGDLLGDETSFYYPIDGKLVELKSTADAQLIEALSYAGNSIPLAMVLSKNFELFFPSESFSIPYYSFNPGSMFALPREFATNQGSYFPPGLFRLNAGARSTFLLANLNNHFHFKKIQDYFGYNEVAPNSIFKHQKLFKQLNNIAETSWRAEILFFSQKWVDCMKKDDAWYKIKNYLIAKLASKYAFRQSAKYYDYIFEVIQARLRLKVDSYLVSIVRHILAIIVGDQLAFSPAVTEDSLPLKLLQSIFSEIYPLQYYPTIMIPERFSAHSSEPVYYSMNYPTNLIFSVKSSSYQAMSGIISDLEKAVSLFFEHMKGPDSLCKKTIVDDILKAVNLDFYHIKKTKNPNIKAPKDLNLEDSRLTQSSVKLDKIKPFAESSTFFRGAVKISHDPDKQP